MEEMLIGALAKAMGVSSDDMKGSLDRLLGAEKKLDDGLRYFKLRMDRVDTMLNGSKPQWVDVPGLPPQDLPTEPAFMAEIRELFAGLNQRMERLENAAGIDGSSRGLNGHSDAACRHSGDSDFA
jgi:hypothetical protein